MNKIKSIYPTEIEQESRPIKEAFDKFRNRLDAKIKDTIVIKKNLITRQSSQHLEQLNRIKEHSQKYKKKIYEQQQEFEQKIESHIQYDISKWNDYQSYFKDSFDQLEHNIQLHKLKNKERLKKIRQKKIQLKEMLQEEKISHERVSSLLKRADQNSSNKTTKQSSVQLSYSRSNRNRIKTESSLPTLKPSNRFDRIKTIHSECSEEQSVVHFRPKRVFSYMQPIGTLREKEESSFPILIEMLQWYKDKEEQTVGDNWFLKILFSNRNFTKLIRFMKSNSSIRRIQKKL